MYIRFDALFFLSNADDVLSADSSLLSAIFIQTIMFTFHFIISADERLCAEHKETQNKIFVRGHFRVIKGKKIYVRAHYRKR